MIAIVVTLCIYLIYYVNSESYQCMNNTPKYMIKNMEKGNYANVTCMCYSDRINSARVIIDNNGMRPMQ